MAAMFHSVMQISKEKQKRTWTHAADDDRPKGQYKEDNIQNLHGVLRCVR